MPRTHKIEQGDCLTAISENSGHFWETVWEDPANAALKEARENPNVLFPGDEVVIPDLREKTDDREADRRHRFRRKGVPAMLVLKVMDGWKPRAKVPFVLEVDGVTTTGSTDAEGVLKTPIPATAKAGTLKVGLGDDAVTYYLDLGHLNPVTEASGLKQRLRNLGYVTTDVTEDALSETEIRSLRRFQSEHDLEVTGKADDATRARLVEICGH